MAKILVVDDEVSIRMGIREFAEYQGYEVEEAANGKEAVERCRQKDFDVIIMDIMMPEMDGYEAYKKIREIKDFILGGTLLASGLFSNTVGHLDPLGILCALLSAVSCATFMFLSARVGCDLPPIERGLVVCLGACILGFAVCPDYFSSGALQAGIWKYGLILGVFGLFVPVVLFGIGTPHLSAGLSTIMASSELPCGIAISVLVLSEPVDALQTAGIAVIMLGVAVSQLPNLLPQGASARFRKKRLQ